MNEDETNKEVADVLHSIADILSGKVKRDKSFAVSKLDLFGGTADLEAWARIEEYLSSGKASDLSAKERVWLDLLMLIHSLDWKYGKLKEAYVIADENSTCAVTYDNKIILVYDEEENEIQTEYENGLTCFTAKKGIKYKLS